MLRAVIVGCGNVAIPYGEALERRPGLYRIAGAHSRTAAKAEAFVARFGGRVYDGLNEILADQDVDVVVNLTSQVAHADITAQCLAARKHVYSEKPLALTAVEARDLVELAARHGVRLSSAPSTFLGPPQQEAIRLVRSGRLGTVRIVYAEVNWGRIERWHPSPEAFYDVGPVVDVGVYPITLLTAALGAVIRVSATGRVVLPRRTALDGGTFAVVAPDFLVTLLELACGALVRLTASFYVPRQSVQAGIEFHGDDASLHLASWFEGDGTLALAQAGASYVPLPAPSGTFSGVDYGLGLTELAAAIADDRPQLASGGHAAHVAEVVEAVAQSIMVKAPVEISPPLAGFPA